MSRTIKLEDHVYSRLARLQVGRETFSQTVERLIFIRDKAVEMIQINAGGAAFEEWKANQK